MYKAKVRRWGDFLDVHRVQNYMIRFSFKTFKKFYHINKIKPHRNFDNFYQMSTFLNF